MKREEGCFKKAGYRFCYAAITDCGCVRENNEDDFIIIERHGVFAVADGVGGLSRGEDASREALLTIEKSLDGKPSFLRRCFTRKKNSLLARLQLAVANANDVVSSLASQYGEKLATTLVLFAVTAGEKGADYIVSHVGDSRGYLFRNGVLLQLTEDHTVGRELSQSIQGQISSAYSNVITRALGAEEEVTADFQTAPLLSGDILLLCSDGLSSMISDAGIQRVLENGESPLLQAEQLLSAAKGAGGKDNITVVLICCNNEGRGPVLSE